MGLLYLFYTCEQFPHRNNKIFDAINPSLSVHCQCTSIIATTVLSYEEEWENAT
jgi:hypothetical protein